jgi:hypothetical protein
MLGGSQHTLVQIRLLPVTLLKIRCWNRKVVEMSNFGCFQLRSFTLWTVSTKARSVMDCIVAPILMH